MPANFKLIGFFAMKKKEESTHAKYSLKIKLSALDINP